MSHGSARSDTEQLEAPLGCPTPWRHRILIPAPSGGPAGAAVPVIALSCPGCVEPSAADQLRQVVAARRRTLAGLAGLPEDTRAELTAAGILEAIYSGTLTEVREAARRQESLGVAPPSGLCEEAATVERVTAVLDAAGGWLATLTG